MKQKYVSPSYGLGSWRKTDTFTRNVYDFSGKPTLGERLLSLTIWSSLLAFIGLIIYVLV